MTRQTVVTGIVTFLLGVGVSHLLERPGVAQVGGDDSPRPHSTAGRYRVTTTGAGTSAYMVLIDTTTGETWTRTIPYRTEWSALGNPRNAEQAEKP
jgi:hypothetical protein